MQNKNFLMIGTFLVLSLISINFVSAFAISSTYIQDKQLYLMPGESSEVRFLLQNGDANDVKVTVNLQSGSNVAEIIDKQEFYLIKAGTDQVVYLNVEIPSNAAIGEQYNVVASFDIKPDIPNQALSFGSSINQNFDVIIGVRPGVEEKEEVKDKLNWILILVLLILILAVIIIIVNYLSKKSKTKKNIKKRR